MSAKVGEGGYSKVLEITKMTPASLVRCQAKCMQTWGCVYYNYHKKLSACHFADPLDGSVTDKPGSLSDWSIYKIDQLWINNNEIWKVQSILTK